ncbi:nuclear transport factor 2 family protein [Acidovorax cavernicola]|uniref:Nuclear transport factor 2 family protein n=1 Tax=Acidovorax cavernicola TaxID=1675792 RepID=A0A9X8D8A7_9BURK|nr:nuclear transport factor 2 family protein [Acidovorax cavernicola]RIX84621.1 nuclear transport factor 2 family protein [Acidovorax cavernicola]
MNTPTPAAPAAGEIQAVVQRYAQAWAANDLKAIVDSYHDEVVFHYFGRSPLAGTHRGKAACLAVLKQVKERTNRRLVAIRDVLAGEHFGLIVAVEQFEHQGRPIELERQLRYAVKDGKLSECWIYDEDQRWVDEVLSSDAQKSSSGSPT